MALYRTVSVGFWTDVKVVDDFTPEDKYFYLYLFTNPHTNLCGCYGISYKHMVNELGYSRETIESLITRFETIHNVIRYSRKTKEMLLLNWHKYNWTSSVKFRTRLLSEINEIKEESYKEYLYRVADGENLQYGIDTVSDSERYGSDTSNTVTNTISNTVSTSTSKDIEEEDIDNRGSGGKKEKEKGEKEKADGESAGVFYEDPALNKAFEDFVAMRKKIRKPLATDRAIKMAMNKLEKLATNCDGFDKETAIEILDQSILGAWTGLYPLERNRGYPRDVNQAIDWSSL